ncbi:hypothetical protein LEP1GSC086_2768 [Leptospira weilii str. LNT 1234]|nr:hypothetical protein LEP1GSC086_2768 [Leptospira weilii str. LNT 1234]
MIQFVPKHDSKIFQKFLGRLFPFGLIFTEEELTETKKNQKKFTKESSWFHILLTRKRKEMRRCK